MPTTEPPRGRQAVRALVALVGLTALYFVSGRMGLRLDSVGGVATLIWPPSGLSLVALLVLGRRLWPAVALGALLVNLDAGIPWPAALGIATGNTLEALLGTTLLRSATGHSVGFDRKLDVLCLLAAALGASLLGATIGVGSAVAGGVLTQDEAAVAWTAWWLGDSLGILLLAPLILVWRNSRHTSLTRRPIETGLLGVTLVGVCYMLFMEPLVPGGLAYFLFRPWIVFPLLMWAAVRFGTRGAVISLVSVEAIALWGTLTGTGPFALRDVTGSLIIQQCYMIAVAVATLLLSATTSEQKRIAAELETEREQLEQRVASRTEELRRTNAELKSQTDWLTLALDASQSGAWEWHVQSDTIDWSPDIMRTSGIAAHAYDGRFSSYLSVIHPDDRGDVEAAMAAALEGKQDYEAEYRAFRSDGSVIWRLARGKVRRNADGTAASVYGVCMDITRVKQAERRLQEEDRRKDQFIAMLSHELRNPLAPVARGLELLTPRVAKDLEGAKLVTLMGRQLRHLKRLVDDILDVSRIAGGKISLKREPVSLASVLTLSIDATTPILAARRQSLSVELGDAAEITVAADEQRLAQVFNNLLVNASKFSPDGAFVSLTVSRSGADVKVAVQDSGSGIDPDLLPRVFDTFVQGDQALDRPQGGLGLGLAIARELVAMHGGTIAAASGGAGKGSCFTVTLPTTAAKPAVLPQRPSPLTPFGKGEAKLRILVVDDNVDAAECLAMTFDLWGHQVKVAHDGRNALTTASSFHPDVVFLDIGLPGMDGYAVAQALRESDPGRTTRLIALTGYGRVEDREQAEKAGFDMHIVKPAETSELRRVLAEDSRRKGEGRGNRRKEEASTIR
jgi:PAS domain S-box-containing protein